MKHILVTGGLGYIGSHTVVELSTAGYKPIIIDNLSNSDESVLKRLEDLTGQSIPFYKGNFQNQSLLAKVLAKESIDGIIHFAASKAVGESVQNPLKYYANNVSGFVMLLETLEATKKPMNIVFSSSCTVYGNADKLPVTEAAPIKPAVSPYGATKQMDETILRDATAVSKNFSSIALRYFNPIGAHPSGLIGELPIGTPANLVPFITQAVAGLRPKLTVHGNDYPTPDGTCIRDYIHVVDLAKAHIKAIEFTLKQPRGSYEVCNIGTESGSSVLEVIQTFEKTTGQKVPYSIGPRRDGDVIASYASTHKANKLLDWQATKTLADALRDAWNWQQKLSNQYNKIKEI